MSKIEQRRSTKVGLKTKRNPSILQNPKQQSDIHKDSSILDKSTVAAAGTWKNKPIEKEVKQINRNTKIWDDSMNQFVIKPGDLLMMRAELFLRKQNAMLSKSIEYQNILVKKTLKIGNGKRVGVWRKAPSNAELCPLNVESYAGPRFRENGEVIEHSLLGTLDEFKKMARDSGKYGYFFKPAPRKTREGKTKSKTVNTKPTLGPQEHWQSALALWKKTRECLAGKVCRPVGDLLMNTTDIYPQHIQERELIEKYFEGGIDCFGERHKAARFWTQQPYIGMEDECIHSTLTKTQKGNNCDIHHIGMPSTVLKEKGMEGDTCNKRSYPAYYTNYTEEQKAKVMDVIHIVNPHHPLLQDLQVTGEQIKRAKTLGYIPDSSNDLATDYQDLAGEGLLIQDITMTVPSRGPALNIGGRVYAWLGLGNARAGQVMGVASILFDGKVGERILNHLVVKNTGSTAVYYSWQKHVQKTIDIPRKRGQKFYFDESDGVIAPGETMKMAVLCCSESSGVYRESWKFVTRPLLCQGADIVVSFKAVIHPVDPPGHLLDSLKEMFARREAEKMAKQEVDFILLGVKTPEATECLDIKERQPSPAEIFRQKFPKFHFHASKWNDLETLFKDICDNLPENVVLSEECTVPTLVKALTLLLEEVEVPQADSDGEGEEQNSKMHKFQSKCTRLFFNLCTDLSFTSLEPIQDKYQHKCNIVCRLLQGSMDCFSDLAFITAHNFGLPLRVDEEEDFNTPTKRNMPKKSIAKVKKRDIEKALSPKPELRSSVSQRMGGKAKSPPTTVVVIERVSPEKDTESFLPIIVQKVTPEKMTQYRERLYMQMYSLLENTMDQMLNLLEDSQ